MIKFSNTLLSKLHPEFAMEPPKDTIKYIRPVYNNKPIEYVQEDVLRELPYGGESYENTTAKRERILKFEREIKRFEELFFDGLNDALTADFINFEKSLKSKSKTMETE